MSLAMNSEVADEFVDLREDNPWKVLHRDSQTKYLEGDREDLAHINRRAEGKKTEVRLEQLPEPFVGNPNSPIWLLNLNPGFDETDLGHNVRIVAAQQTNLHL